MKATFGTKMLMSSSSSRPSAVLLLSTDNNIFDSLTQFSNLQPDLVFIAPCNLRTLSHFLFYVILRVLSVVVVVVVSPLCQSS